MHEYIVRLFLFCMVLRFEISAFPTVLALFQFFFFFFFFKFIIIFYVQPKKIMFSQES